jgi:hypothetical protein
MMVCPVEKMAIGASLATLAGSGIIAIVGAPTVVLSAAGAAGAVGALLGVAASVNSLKECYEQRGRMADAEKLAHTVEQLQMQVADIRTRFRLA